MAVHGNFDHSLHAETAMVSFQCHGCGDVVKKPKLDQHRSRCYTGFDCIDCSKSFNTPADYKGHTSCISEAEKYQKTLYRGPKTGQKSTSTQESNFLPDEAAPITNAPVSRQSNAQWNRRPQSTSPDNVNGYSGVQFQTQNGRRNDRNSNHFGHRGGRNPSWRQSRSHKSGASGANDTPLGMPKRSSIYPGVVENGQDSATCEKGYHVENPRTEATTTENKRQNEKRKRQIIENSDTCSSGKNKSTQTGNLTLEESDAAVDKDTTEKKEKRRKKIQGSTEGGAAEADTAGSDIKVKEKRRSEKDDEAGSGDKKGTRKPEKNNDNEVEIRIAEANEVEDQTTKTKKKKKKRSTTKNINPGDSEAPGIVTGCAADDERTSQKEKGHGEEEGKRRKKEKKKPFVEEYGEVDSKEIDEKKEKKRKREEETKDGKKKKRKHNSEL